MSAALYFSLGLLLVTAVIWWLLIHPRRRYQRALDAPFSNHWRAILRRNLAVYCKLPQHQRHELEHLIKGFLHGKQFVGCGGQQITDEVRLTIAAQACLLLLNRANTLYRELRYIYVYPAAYLVPHTEWNEDGTAVDLLEGREGESWDDGKLILSWDNSAHGARDFRDGRNLVLHEFAHQLDQESGVANGAPLMEQASSYRSWAQVLSREYEELQGDLMRGHQGLLDHYGATNPAEFFAVVTETFYEQPDQMAAQHPALFAQLKNYYAVDPREWL